MWSWIAHRGTGIAVMGFLFLHILDTSLVALGPKHYNQFVKLYKTSVFRPLEVLLVGAVIFHAINGLRVVLIDFWSKGVRYEHQLAKIQLALSLSLFLPAAFMMLRPLF